jgi:hypothetical protein
MKTAEQIVQQTLKENPEIRLVLEIAARARDAEDKTPPVDFTPKNEVIAVPNNQQFPLHS